VRVELTGTWTRGRTVVDRRDWTGGLATLFHRFGVLAFGWDAQTPRVLDELIDLGIDGVYSDHVDRMVAAVDAAYPTAG